MIIYDCEIIKAIGKKGEERTEGIEYCDGWRDFEGMGISVICTYDYTTDRYGAFCEDNFDDFRELVQKSNGPIVGFNSLSFDNKLCAANSIDVSKSKSYDILVEIWKSVGLGSEFKFTTHVGFGLDAVVEANFGLGKTGHGANAPIQWQREEYGRVIRYCLDDVWLTKKVLDKIIRFGGLKSPKDKKFIRVRRPG